MSRIHIYFFARKLTGAGHSENDGTERERVDGKGKGPASDSAFPGCEKVIGPHQNGTYLSTYRFHFYS